MVIFLAIAMIFLKYGDADNRFWFALFKENEYMFILGLLLAIRKMVKYVFKTYFIPDKRIRYVFTLLDACIAYISFYIVFHVAILFDPLRPYRDFTQNPAIIALFIWGLVVFVTIEILTNDKR